MKRKRKFLERVNAWFLVVLMVISIIPFNMFRIRAKADSQTNNGYSITVKDANEELINDVNIEYLIKAGNDSIQGNVNTINGVALIADITSDLITDTETAGSTVTIDITATKDGYIKYTGTGIEVTKVDDNIDIKMLEKAIDDTFKFSSETVEISCYESFTNTASSSKRTGIVQYSVESSDVDDCVSVDSDGVITTKKAGNATIKAVLPEDDDYKESQATYNITVNKIDDSNFEFNITKPEAIIYSEDGTYTNKASGGLGNGDITYSIISGGECATIDIDGTLHLLKAGTVTVEATKASDGIYNEVKAQYTLIINRAQQGLLQFKEEAPADVLITNGTFSNEATGGNSAKAITYEIVDGFDYASIEDNTSPVITLKKAGTIVVKAKRTGDDRYEDSSEISYKLTIKKAQQDALEFSTTNPQISYSNDWTYTVEATGGSSSKETKYYIIENGNRVEENDIAKINLETGVIVSNGYKTGTIIVQAVKEADDIYEEASIDCNVTINKAVQKIEFNEKDVGVTYGDNNNIYLNEVKGVQSKSSIAYSIENVSTTQSGNKCATIDSVTGEVTIYGAGSISVKAVIEEDDCYLASNEAYYTLTISKAEQKDFRFDDSVPESVTYNENNNEYTLATLGGNGDGAVEYSVIGDNGVIAIEGNIVKVQKAGTVTIRATKAASDGYNKTYVDKEIIINKAEQSIKFNDTNTTEVIYGNTFSNAAVPVENVDVPDKKGYAADTNITYKVIEGTNIAEVDNNGNLKFKNNSVGRVTVQADKPGDNCYKNTNTTYTIQVKYLETPEQPYKLSGGKLSEDGWYKEDVTIIPAEGYQISASNNLTDNTWQDSIIVTEEGLINKTIYLKNDLGITGAINIPQSEIKIDKEKPENLKIEYSKSIHDILLQGITFGFYKAPVKVIITAEDKTSGVKSFAYSYKVEEGAGDVNTGKDNVVISEGDENFKTDGNKTQAVFEIPAQFKGKVSFTATDKADNKSDICIDNKIIVVDSIAPGVDVTYNNNDVKNSVYYNAGRTATISINEENFFVESLEKLNDATRVDEIILEHLNITVTKVNDEGVSTSKKYQEKKDFKDWFTKGTDGIWRATIEFTEEGDYTLDIDYKDFSESEATYTNKFTIDKTAPQVSIELNKDEAVNGEYYYRQARADIIIKEHNFNPSDIKVTCDSKDADNKKVDVEDYQKLLREGNWEKQGNTYILRNVVFDIDAISSLKIDYEDLAGNPQHEEAKVEFCVDKEKPENLAISYSESIHDILLQKITFGFYKAPVKVTITAEDKTSGVKSFAYSYKVEEGAGDVNTGKDNVVISEGDKNFKSSGSKAQAVFEIPAQFKGKVSFTATDKADNKSDICIDNKIIVVDSIAPGVDVTYNNNDVKNSVYYNAGRTATISINEENFFVESLEKLNDATRVDEIILEHLNITVTKVNDEGVSTSKKYQEKKDFKDWFTKGTDGIWRATIEFTEEGDYTLDIDYKDFSENEATYTNEFTIDKTAPQVSINLNKDEAVSGEYYYRQARADIIIKEHNFRASDIKVTCDSKDADNKKVDIEDYQKLLREGNWEKQGNTYILRNVVFDTDAIYSLKIDYEDLAGNSQQEEAKEEFCVDKEKPVNLAISYSESVKDRILQFITFGYYKAPVKVTISAEDKISGVKSFKYSYEVEEGASDVNTGEKDIVISEGDNNFKSDGSKAQAVFEIPAQFRGKVSFTATDRAENVSEIYKDNKTIVVDDIKPEINVTIDGNNKSNKYEQYYNNYPVRANIEIKEANFDKNSDDLKIKVTTELNDGTTSEKIYKNDDLTKGFSNENNGDIWSGYIEFNNDGHENEDAKYTISVDYSDYSGNAADTVVKQFIVDKTDPVIKVDYSNNDVRNDKYFNADRTAKITIIEHNFNSDDVELNVTNDKAVNDISDFATYLKNPYSWTNNGDIHVAEIPFTVEAYYTFDISYTDMSGRKNTAVDYGNSKAVNEFVIDKTAPTNSDILIDDNSVLAVNGIAFEKFYRNDITVKFTTNADISGVKSIKYQKINEITSYDINGVWIDYDLQNGILIKPNEKFVVYFMVEDMAGNVTIVNSTGIVVDDKAPSGENAAPQIDIFPNAANRNGIHNSNVNVAMTVVDPKYLGSNQDINGYYSGINKITYRVYTTDTDAVETGTLMDISSGNVDGAVYDNDRLISSWNGNIIIDSQKFNSNNVIVEVTAIDNAGNERVTNNEMIGQYIKIDITAPVIDISYDNNSADNEVYFKEDRTARIQITERNFNADDVNISIVNTDGVIPSISGWTQNSGSGNMDDTTWVTYITYDADGDYNFDIKYTDMADNECQSENYNEGTIAAKEFTIDKTIPVIDVTYDNNEVENSNYYKSDRVATITITEHNFQADRVNISMTATDDGNAVATPDISGWTSDGDRNTATINYNSDAYFTFSINTTDMAGNISEEFAEQNFYIDKTLPELSITGIENNTANSGTVMPVISYSDTNYDESMVSITLTGANRKNVELDGTYSDQNNGRVFTFNNFENDKSIDDIYTLTASITDRAGNSSTQTIVFSVNRFGSTYQLDTATELLNGKYVKQAQDIVISEVNVDRLDNIKITLYKNDETVILKENVDYKINITGGNGEWYYYTYVIFAKNFTDNGVYRLTIQSDDETGRTQKTDQDVKDVEIQFGIDDEPPVINVKNLDSRSTYALESKDVELTVRDNLKLSKVIAELDGEEYRVWSDEELDQIVKDGGDFTFNINGNSTSAHNLLVYAVDAAGNGEKSADSSMPSNVVNITDFYVTTNKWVQYFNNKPLFYGSIIGVVALAGLAVTIITVRRRKLTRAS